MAKVLVIANILSPSVLNFFARCKYVIMQRKIYEKNGCFSSDDSSI